MGTEIVLCFMVICLEANCSWPSKALIFGQINKRECLSHTGFEKGYNG